MRIPIIPSWCKGLPDTTILFSCDILEFFGYHTNQNRACDYVREGLIPEPNAVTLKLTGSKNKTKYQWLLGDIRNLRAEMLKNK